MTSRDARRDDDPRPWTHRQSYPVRMLITLLAGVAVAVIGTFAHRMGASMNVPYGLVLAYVILGLSAWCARARCGVTGLAVHLIASTATAWMIAAGSGNDALTPIGFNSDDLPYFSQKAGYLWLIGMIVVQLAFTLMPPRWFRIEKPKPRAASEDDVKLTDDADASASTDGNDTADAESDDTSSPAGESDRASAHDNDADPERADPERKDR
ncbi:alcohol dehydrogenase [Bifidobacterium aerophilum]|uniref:alcohol dehydrogenase n=1 Tax=Bifidobacterium aerophilum TaxID=1798155 RepID=UPI001EF76538|nr:alcohol dehydrogenase [Bifidobacterium aerophilum]